MVFFIGCYKISAPQELFSYKLIDQRVLGKTTAKTFDSVNVNGYPYPKNTTNRVYQQETIKKTASLWGNGQIQYGCFWILKTGCKFYNRKLR